MEEVDAGFAMLNDQSERFEIRVQSIEGHRLGTAAQVERLGASVHQDQLIEPERFLSRVEGPGHSRWAWRRPESRTYTFGDLTWRLPIFSYQGSSWRTTRAAVRISR